MRLPSRAKWAINAVDRLGIALLAFLAYVPTMLSSPGKMPADTKAYLYLDPGRLTADSPWTFDPRQFAGWVPHQQITYLWPSGPWYWFWDTLGMPDWVAHRLWLGTVLLAGGLGVRWVAKVLGLGPAGALGAALVYQLSPYVLPYVSRTSLMLLPWAGVGWIVGLTIRAATRSSWRHVGILALVIATVGSPNATALAMIAPAPVLWLLHAAWSRLITWRRAALTTAKIAVLSLGVSLWWIAMLAVQGRHGAEVLSYSESLEAVSSASTSSEVLRGLGYWLFYLRDAYAATTTAAYDYMASVRVIGAGYLLLALCLGGLVFIRWQHRRFAVWCFAAGALLAIGVHRLDDPAPITDALINDTESGLALALRSSTRALPMATLGLALGAGALVTAVRPRRSWVRMAVPVALVVVAVVNMPSLWRRDYVDPALTRDQDPPAAWDQAVDALDAMPPGYRVFQLPGQEFGAFRWGYTVDPPLPGLTERPLVTRDLLPLGSPPAMDLLFALDDRFQDATIEPQAIAPVSRLLGADTIWVTNDSAFDRFRTPRPEVMTDLYRKTPDGLGEPVVYGDPFVNEPDVTMTDERSVSDELIGTAVPPVMLVPVDEPVPVVRTKLETVLVSGSGDGVVDAAAAGILDGTELIRYSADLGDRLRPAIRNASEIIVTDSNRDRARRWNSSQDSVGFTESGGPATDLLRVESADSRLPVFASSDPTNQTVATQQGPVTAIASAYGEPFAFRPEDRAAMAIDGDPKTAWRVSDRFATIGERIVLTTTQGIDHVTLLQPRFSERQRHITAIDLLVADRPPQRIELGPESLTGTGQRIEFEPSAGATGVEITVAATQTPTQVSGPRLAAVGFAEIDVGLGPTTEVVRPPTEVLDLLPAVRDRTPVSLVFTRLRHDPTDRFRADPEQGLERSFSLGEGREMGVDVTVRLDPRATDEVLGEVLGVDGPVATDRLAGVPGAAAWAVADGEPDTAWISPFAYPGEHVLDIPLGDGRVPRRFTITQPRTGDFSTITSLLITAGERQWTVDVPEPDGSGTSIVTLPEAVDAEQVQVAIAAFDGVVITDRRYAEPVFLPVAISELSLGERVTMPDEIDLGCRRDLVQIDGETLGVRLSGSLEALLAGEPFTATPCAAAPLSLDAGEHRISASRRATTGLTVDRLVLTSEGSRVESSSTGEADADGFVPTEIVSRTRTSARATVGPCPQGCWFVFGEGYNDAWSAKVVTPTELEVVDPGAPTDRGTTQNLGAPTPVDGGFNGWFIRPTDDEVEVTVEWTAQRSATFGLLLSGVFIAVAVALTLLDRSRSARSVEDHPELASVGSTEPAWHVAIGVMVGLVTAVMFIRPAWALPVAVVGAVAIVLRRVRLVGAAGLAVALWVGGSTAWTIWRERPFPSGLWLESIDGLHFLGLLAIVLVFTTSVLPDDARTGANGSEKSPSG